jgi:Protein of unknown function (DUF2738)
MAASLITSVADFAPARISYGAPRSNPRGGKNIRILDANRNPLVLGTPLMLTWGVNKMVDEDTGKVSYNLSLQFPNSEYGNADTTAFLHKMQEFENKILDDAVANSKDWFNKKSQTREVAQALFTPILKYPKDQASGEPDMSRAPTLRVTMPFWEGKFNFELYDMEQTPIFTPAMSDEVNVESLVPKGAHVAAVLSCGGIWFAAGKFGVTWKLVQAIVRRPLRISGGCFVQLSNTDRQAAAAASKREVEDADVGSDGGDDVVGAIVDDVPVAVSKPAVAAAASASAASSHFVADSDNEDSKADDAPAVAKPARKVVKKTVKA